MLRPFALLVGMLVLGYGTTVAGSDEPNKITDENIGQVLEREFLFDSAVPSNEIDMAVDRGIVTLEGTVPSLLAKERAERRAETVKGVRSVVNLIAVSRGSRTDEQIRKDVEQALLLDPAADSYEISVSVSRGHVTLSGSVESLTEKDLSATVAKGVHGVTGVSTDDVRVEFATDRPDAEIRNEVVQALHWNALVDDGLIDVAVQDGNVTLSGTVGSAAEKRHARLTAWTQGVRSVDDSGLDVARWARDEDLQKQKYVDKTDSQVEDAVEAALVRDPRVLSLNVTPSARSGVVTLRGTVDNLRAKRAAESDARNTVGVLSVKNYLKVRPLVVLADEVIESSVRSALDRDPYLEPFEVSVSVHGGTAYLYGSVDSYFEKAQADDIVSRSPGVVNVVNHLRVADATPYAYDPLVDDWRIYDFDWYEHAPTYSYKSDWEIRMDIENELWWSPFVDSDEVDVAVEDGVATLTGTVDSWRERGAARDNAYDGGATWVRNRLNVQ